MKTNRQRQILCLKGRCIAFLLVFIVGFAACGGEASGPLPPGTSETCPRDLCPGGCNSSGQCLGTTTQSTTPGATPAPAPLPGPVERQVYTISLKEVRFDKNFGISSGGVLCMADARILLWAAAALPFGWTVYGFMKEAIKLRWASKMIKPFLTSVFGAVIVAYISDDACDPYVTVSVGDKKKKSTTKLDAGDPFVATLLGGKATWENEPPLLSDITLDELKSDGIRAEVFDDDGDIPIGVSLLGNCLPKSHPEDPQLSPAELSSLQSTSSLTLELQCSRDDIWASWLGVTAYVTLEIEEAK